MNAVLESLKSPSLGADSSESDGMLVVRATNDISRHPHEVYLSMIERRLNRQVYPDWLDVGCGWHFDWPWEMEREKALLSHARVVGMDPDWQAIVRHRTIGNRTVGLVERLPFASSRFDLVTANVVVEHLKYPSLAFAEIFRVLKDGGSFVFRTPSARSYFVKIARWLPQSVKLWLATRALEHRNSEDVYPAHYRANTAEVVGDICQVVGFRRVEVTITRARGFLNKVPMLARVERAGAAALRMTEGNLIVEARK
jgi:ubiquinone/menaquinone biosynthesis C-methylase UbiE